jgi:hypothetical protein
LVDVADAHVARAGPTADAAGGCAQAARSDVITTAVASMQRMACTRTAWFGSEDMVLSPQSSLRPIYPATCFLTMQLLRRPAGPH